MESEAHAFDSQEQENTDILMSSPVSTPTNVANRVSIKFDKTTGVFSGVPPQILEKLQQQGYSLEDVEKDPLLIKDFLYEQNLEETLKPTKPPADSKNPLFQRTKYIFDFGNRPSSSVRLTSLAMESWYHILEDVRMFLSIPHLPSAPQKPNLSLYQFLKRWPFMIFAITTIQEQNKTN